jgi:hypothetical protein
LALTLSRTQAAVELSVGVTPAVCNVIDYGASGNGAADDTQALQAAIDCGRNFSRTVVLPAGVYKITSFLDWGGWQGISVRGDGSSGRGAVTQITAAGISGVAHDFTGSSYGIVENIAFGGSADVMVLNGRTSDGSGAIYGSDLTWRGCNFDGGNKAAFVDHMGEVLTWDNCRFHSGGGAPSLSADVASPAPTMEHCTALRASSGHWDYIDAISNLWRGNDG